MGRSSRRYRRAVMRIQHRLAQGPTIDGGVSRMKPQVVIRAAPPPLVADSGGVDLATSRAGVIAGTLELHLTPRVRLLRCTIIHAQPSSDADGRRRRVCRAQRPAAVIRVTSS